MLGDDLAPPVSSRGTRTARRLLLAGSVLLAMVAFLIGTPFALLAVATIQRDDWAVLSNVGEAYGGFAAVFGMLALAGVAVSLVLQSRDSATTRELAQRTIHSDLMFKALDDSDLRACWGPLLHGDYQHDRQHVYSNLIVSFWRSMFEIGNITESQLRALSAHMFADVPGRRYWSIAGPHQGARPTTERDRAFIQVLDQEYARATAWQPSTKSPEPAGYRSSWKAKQGSAAMVGAGLAGGLIISATVAAILRGRRRSPKSLLGGTPYNTPGDILSRRHQSSMSAARTGADRSVVTRRTRRALPLSGSFAMRPWR